MFVMQRGECNRWMAAACQHSQGYGLNRGTCGSGAGLRDTSSRLSGTDADGRHGAHPALARAHGYRAVPLQEFNFVEALDYAVAQIFLGNVFAQAYELFFSVLRIAYEGTSLGAPAVLLFDLCQLLLVVYATAPRVLCLRKVQAHCRLDPGNAALQQGSRKVMYAR